MPKLSVLDVSENPLVCNKDFKALMTWVVKKTIVHGPIDKTHAAMQSMRQINFKFMNPKTVQESWQTLAYNVCTSVNKDSLDGNEDPEDSTVDGDDDDDYDSYIDDVSEEFAKEDQGAEPDSELIGGLTVKEVEKKKIHREEHPIVDDNSYEEIFDELEKHVEEVNQADFRRTWYTIAIFTLCCVVLALITVRVASIMMNKRHERYRQAILANKNSFVYQKLSEERIGGSTGKIPAVPKVHRYQPIEQV